MSRVLLPVAVAGALLAVQAAASAVVVYTNFGPGDSFDTSSSLQLFGPTHASGVVQHWAATFTPGSDVFLDSVEVALEHAEGSTSVLVRVTGDDSGFPDLSFLEEVTVMAPMTPK